MEVNLVLFKKDGSQKTFALPSESSVIGRRHDCDLKIPLKEVSKRHCQLTVNNSTLKVRDLGSTNGTFVNGQRIDEIEAKSGDYVRVGPLTFQLQIDGQPAKASPPPTEMAEGPARKAEPGDSFLDFSDEGEDNAPLEGDLGDDLPGEGDLDAEFADLDSEGDDSFLGDLDDL